MKLGNRLEKANHIIFVMLGLGLCYPYIDYLYEFPFTGYGRILLVSDAVSIPAFFIGALLAWHFMSIHRKGALLIGAPILSTLGILLLSIPENVILETTGAAFMAIGFTALFLMWLELYGCLTPINAAISISGSGIVHVIIFLLLQHMDAAAVLTLISLFPLISTICLVAGSRSLPEVSLPRFKPAADPPRLWLLIVWMLVFGLATGFGRDVTGVAAGGLASVFGRLLPALIVFIGTVFCSRRFDFKVIYCVIASLMAIGILLMAIGMPNSYISAFFTNAGSDGCTMLVAIIACGTAYIARMSSAFECGILLGFECAGFYVGGLLAERFYYVQSAISVYRFAIEIVLMLAVLIVTIILYKSDDLLSKQYGSSRLLDIGQDEASAIDRFVQNMSEQYSLSRTESTVLKMLVQGANRASIGESLFIAPVTVRVHISRICKKMGMASSDELNEYLTSRNLHSAVVGNRGDSSYSKSANS